MEVRNLEKTYEQGDRALTIFKDVSFSLDSQDMVALVGASGAGKSTLLHIMGLLDRQTRGEILLEGRATSDLPDSERTRLRLQDIGFVYQYHYLQPEFSAVENVILPQLIAGKSKDQARDKAESLLVSLGLGERLSHRPARLSGGEQQRVAIARALANDPRLLLADEPTGNLDEDTSETVFAVLLEHVKKMNVSLFVATHSLGLAEKMDRVMEIRKGALISL